MGFYRKYFCSTESLARFNGVNIGNYCDIQKVSFGSEPYLVTIGNHVQITSGTKIFTHGAAWLFREKIPNMDFFGKVVIKDNVYIGNKCLIMSGVTIGSNVLVAAGSVVTKSIANNVVIAGNPAKIICSIEDFERKMLSKNVESKGMSEIEKKRYLLSLNDGFFIQK